MSVQHPEEGNLVWTCVNDHIIDEKEDYKDIGLRGFDYKVFKEEEGGGTIELLDGYPYLNHLIQLWPGDWVKQMKKMNEVFVIKNHYKMNEGGKRSVRPFNRQEFWKCIGCILSEVTYEKKVHKLWSEIPKYFGRMATTKLSRDVRGNTDLYKVCCAHYRHFYIYAFH